MVTSKQQAQVSSVLRETGEQVAYAHVAVSMARDGAEVSLSDAADLLQKAHSNLSALSATLKDAGVLAPTVQRGNTDLLAGLRSMDTPDVRRLLVLLQEAQEIAERVDLSRGHAVDDDLPLLPGESRGTDLAESISVLCSRLRQETRGAVSPHE